MQAFRGAARPGSPPGPVLHLITRRERFVGQSEGKKTRPTTRREDPSFERYPKNFSDSRRNEPPPRAELRDTERRDVRGERDERRAVLLHDRPDLPPPRHPRDTGPGPSRPTSWKGEGGLAADKRDARYTVAAAVGLGAGTSGHHSHGFHCLSEWRGPSARRGTCHTVFGVLRLGVAAPPQAMAAGIVTEGSSRSEAVGPR